MALLGFTSGFAEAFVTIQQDVENRSAIGLTMVGSVLTTSTIKKTKTTYRVTATWPCDADGDDLGQIPSSYTYGAYTLDLVSKVPNLNYGDLLGTITATYEYEAGWV